jgi:tetratricopeptide (TPR) repeat protein
MALRGLDSLFTGRPERLVDALETLEARTPGDVAVLDALVAAHRAAGQVEASILALQRRTALDERDPAAWLLGSRLFLGLGQWLEAEKHALRALELAPDSDEAAGALEQVALALIRQDFERGLGVYEELLRLRPKDPYARNNLGFVLRETVTPYTDFGEGQVQTLKPDAPPRVRELLVRCAEVYREAAALIPSEEDESRDATASWNLAGIVNDYGLIVHYFADVRDLAAAEAAYQRALRMTDHAFKDTYAPNLERLYGQLLPGRELAWYRAAVKARDAVLKEEPDGQGGVRLVPDEAKRAAAAEDARRLRQAIREELDADAEGD